MKSLIAPVLAALLVQAAAAAEFHVSIKGNDADAGSAAKPLRSISAAARVAQPGDTITVHAGTYRERVTPPRGGASDTRRIVYQAVPGEKVEISGSEAVTNWARVQDGVWKVTLPNSFFGGFNPYSDRIRGDWFNGRGREHHTGAVYLNGDWLTEAAKLEEVLMPAGTSPQWLARGGQQVLLNVAWLRTGPGAGEAGRIPATRFAAKSGTKNAPCTEGGECVGWIEHGHWLRYEKVDFGPRAEMMEIRAASETEGGIIEIRLDTPEGELLGACPVPNTGGWQTWSTFTPKLKPVSGVRTVCLVFKSHPSAALNPRLWFAQVDQEATTIWAQFQGVNPNEQRVEINVRRTVFYPDKPGVNYLTVRGFALRHAATPWAPPTAEQIGLIGTHWSKGWIIESNVVSHSTCSGIALGKYGDEFDNTSADTAEGYVKTIERALQNGWNKETIGHHVVRNNTISHCEQAGIVGSLGAMFSTVTGNTIHDIHVRRLFTGAEMAGIKFHAAIDTTIQNNHIYRTCRGLWLDWMAQGTRVSGNLFHDNAAEDLFMEVNHGPYLVDNNVFLSNVNLLDMSEGGAFAHNLFNGQIISRPEPNRSTPYHPAHATVVAGLATTKGGDNRFHNNLFIGKGGAAGARKPAGKSNQAASGYGLSVYDERELPLQTGGNLYYHGSKPHAKETQPTEAEANPRIKLLEEGGRFYLQVTCGPELKQAGTGRVTTALLGKTAIPQLPYENPDGSPLTVDRDYFGQPRAQAKPTPGPFENPGAGELRLKVW